ncbi:LysR family transcriptional regulator [Streptomyces cinnamoneus]|uniref:LysR family transcriptional regulator n=1 Tax=Streptomyces cinnamoneus TaxID=53446 RepID=A0A2G1XQR7_STRCJ|nr:LysR family transcriptional regulator [Streptomyces cinnamoneus]PHQ49945.1 LysR family transcriptional regulator [Streptomyces cinnamoneus]PHQ53584.1 LysR family transcriptional regulator [Streptomyces cinnamoneus]PHQ53587.1 LysR family transcriptional regulator [Streptomyces cinnamoneus]PPT13278.1 LysR family transcriptional regulator [Streptomyces cinnamoneus]
MLDLSRLRALHAVSVHGSVSAAAVALGYTPSAVSQAITKLERETRTTLLERRGRGVALTDAATRLAETAGQLLTLVERAETDLEEQRGLPTGRLLVGAFASAARGLLPGVLAALRREHPALDARLSEVDPHLSVDLVAQGVLDLAVTFEWDTIPLPAPGGLRRARIGDDLCDVLVPEGHPLAGRERLAHHDLAHQRWVGQPPGTVCHGWLVGALRAAGSEPDLAYQAAENHTQVALVAAGLGIALLPRLGRGPLPEGVRAVPLDPVPVRRLFAYWRTGTARRPAVTETVRLLHEQWPDRTF